MSCDTTDQIIHTRPLQIRETLLSQMAWEFETLKVVNIIMYNIFF